MVQRQMFGDYLLPVGKAAKKLNTSRWTIYRWVRTGKLLGVEVGGYLFIPMTDIKRYQKRHNDSSPKRR